MSSESVQRFNNLPNPSRIHARSNGSKNSQNEWFFDVRYVPTEPNPHHVLFLIQPSGSILHSERLPVGLPTDCDGLAFFPETADEAAPEVTRALIHAFSTRMGGKLSQATAPRKLSTDDPALAMHVSEQLKMTGVRKELCAISCSNVFVPTANSLACTWFQNVKRSVGLSGDAVPPTPHSIAFYNFTPPPDDYGVVDHSESEDPQSDSCLFYSHRMGNSFPRSETRRTELMIDQIEATYEMLTTTSPEDVRVQADHGDAEAAMSYGLRLQCACGCEPNRRLSRVYLIKAAQDRGISKDVRAQAHSLLISWYTASAEDFRSRYLHAACHHANQAAILSGPGRTPPAVLMFLKNVFTEQMEVARHLPYLYKDAWDAAKRRTAEYIKETEKMEVKRLLRPNRYRCAAVGCEIMADTGRMLSRCAGKCDPDKKPSYCSKGCQRADWKNHKYFCKPGAPCSVLDLTSPPKTGVATRHGTLQLPIINGDGSTTVIRGDASMPPEELKEFQAMVQEWVRQNPGVKLPTVEMGRLPDD